MRKRLLALFKTCTNILTIPVLLIGAALIVIGILVSLIFAAVGIAATIVSVLLGLAILTLFMIPGMISFLMQFIVDPEWADQMRKKVQGLNKDPLQKEEPPVVPIRGIQ